MAFQKKAKKHRNFVASTGQAQEHKSPNTMAVEQVRVSVIANHHALIPAFLAVPPHSDRAPQGLSFRTAQCHRCVASCVPPVLQHRLEGPCSILFSWSTPQSTSHSHVNERNRKQRRQVSIVAHNTLVLSVRRMGNNSLV
jgi:hypothetical protein